MLLLAVILTASAYFIFSFTIINSGGQLSHNLKRNDHYVLEKKVEEKKEQKQCFLLIHVLMTYLRNSF